MRTRKQIEKDLRQLRRKEKTLESELAKVIAKELEEDGDPVHLTVCNFERSGQNYEACGLRLINDGRDGDHWYGTLIGTRAQLFDFLTTECSMPASKADDYIDENDQYV